MNYQKKIEQILPGVDINSIMGINNGMFADSFSYYAWPETFGSTSGPFGGIGGSAMSEFTIEAIVDNYTGKALLFCRGKVIAICSNLVPLNYQETLKYKVK